MIKDKAYYMDIDYDIMVSPLSDEDGGGYFAYYKDIKGVMGDGESEQEAIQDVKKAFEAFVEVSLANQDSIPEPINIFKSKRINISMQQNKIIALDNLAKKLHTDRSKILSELTDRLLNGDIMLQKQMGQV